MSKGYPSMTALLGLLAVAGYQNRDKIAEWLGTPARDAHGSVVPPVARTSPATGSAAPSNLEHFTKGGHGETAKSWVNQGANRDIAEPDLERAIGPLTLEHLTQQTGLSRSEILSRLSRELPSAIDRYATDGRRFA